MGRLMTFKWALVFLLISTCLLATEARRGGGGSRGGSRGSSSRGSSSSSSSSSRRTHYDRSRERAQPAPAPRYPPAPPPPPPSAPKLPVDKPAAVPHYRDSNPPINRQPPYNPNAPGTQQKPPPYSPRENPPPYSPQAGQGAPPPYSPQGRPPNYQQGNVQPPPYSPSQGGVPGANYPRQPGLPQGGYPPAGGGISGANYPRQPGMSPGTFPHGAGAGGLAAANYPRQQYYPPNSLGSNVWQPQSGRPAPAYMNYGGLPTGANMETKPLKKKGFLGSLMGMGSHKPSKNKYYGAQPSPFAMGGGYGGMGGSSFGSPMGGFMGKHGSKAAMYTILPYMAARKGPKLFRPRIGFMPLFLPSPFHHHHYHHYHHHGYESRHTDVYSNEYVGKCQRPLAPTNGNVTCKSDYKQIECNAKCDDGYRFNETNNQTENKCWHVAGVWRPVKNFPSCQPVCNRTCLNGGSCIAPDVCGCPPEYRGPNCEFYFLNCDVRKFADGSKISWVCTHSKNGTSCKVKCRSPEIFDTTPAEVYQCSPDGKWTPDTLPKCITADAISNATTVEPDTTSVKPDTTPVEVETTAQTEKPLAAES